MILNRLNDEKHLNIKEKYFFNKNDGNNRQFAIKKSFRNLT